MRQTGGYSPGYSGYDWEGGWDYEPAYISNPQTHKILSLDYDSRFPHNPIMNDEGWGEMVYDIEAINVEKC